MFIAMNRFKVKKGSEEAFETVWLTRAPRTRALTTKLPVRSTSIIQNSRVLKCDRPRRAREQLPNQVRRTRVLVRWEAQNEQACQVWRRTFK